MHGCGRSLHIAVILYVLQQNTASFYILLSFIAGLTGLFCPCVLFGRNVESLREDTPWTTPCICHAICVEGGISLAIATVVATSIFPGIDPGTTCLICEGLFFTWWMCGIHMGQVRQSLQKKYHLKVRSAENLSHQDKQSTLKME